MSENVFKSLDEQLQILKDRELTIINEEKAKLFLLNNNYYRISGYSLTLRNHDVFYNSACFQNIIDIYNFDYELRHILLKYIEVVEVRIKSIYAYYFTKENCPTNYLHNTNFTDKQKHDKIINKINDQIKTRLPHEPYLKHFINDKKQDMPLWAAVDLMTIADISILYSISNETLQNNIALEFGLNKKDNTILLSKMLKGMTIIRNLCAHGSRIFNRLFEQRPWLSKNEKQSLIKDERGVIDNSKLYGFLFYMRKLIPSSEFNNMKKEIELLSDKIPFVNMKHYGFRSDWKEIL